MKFLTIVLLLLSTISFAKASLKEELTRSSFCVEPRNSDIVVSALVFRFNANGLLKVFSPEVSLSHPIYTMGWIIDGENIWLTDPFDSTKVFRDEVYNLIDEKLVNTNLLEKESEDQKLKLIRCE